MARKSNSGIACPLQISFPRSGGRLTAEFEGDHELIADFARVWENSGP